MKPSRPGGELSIPHLVGGALVAGIVSAITRRFVFTPLLGIEQAKAAAHFLMFFLLAYLGMAVTPPGQSPPPLLSGIRLRSGLIFGVVGGLTMLVMNRLWP